MGNGGSNAGGMDGAENSLLLPILSSATASVITGTALATTRYVVSQTDGLSVAMLRYALAAACLLALSLAFYRVHVAKKDFVIIAIFGVFYFCIFPWCISVAMQFVTASSGAIVLTCTPAITLVLATLQGSENWSKRKVLGVLLAIFGAAVAVGHGAADFNGVGWFGYALMIFATLCGAVYAVFSKPYLAKYPPVLVTAIAMVAGATALFASWLVLDFPTGMPHLTPLGWLGILYIGVGGGALSFFLYAWSLGRTAPTATMISLPLNPIAAILAGAVALNEHITPALFIGFCFVVSGMYLVVSRKDGGGMKATEAKERIHEIPLA